MIQSDKFDSFMNFKNNIDKIKSFAHRRLIELFGILILILAFLTLISLMSYNPNDPNFIYSENQVINNFLGIKGSILADFLLQSVGIISYFFPVTLIFLSISLFFEKKLVLTLNSLFYLVCYSIIGSVFLTQFYIANFNVKLSYYIQLILFFILFLISINFKLAWLSYFKKTLKKNKSINDVKKVENNNENFTNSEVSQESFAFDRTFPKIDDEKRNL